MLLFSERVIQKKHVQWLLMRAGLARLSTREVIPILSIAGEMSSADWSCPHLSLQLGIRPHATS